MINIGTLKGYTPLIVNDRLTIVEKLFANFIFFILRDRLAIRWLGGFLGQFVFHN